MGTVKFFLKNEQGTDRHLIMMRIYKKQFDGGRFQYSTGEMVDPKKWIEESFQVKDNPKLNKVIRTMTDYAEEHMLENKFKGFTNESLRTYLNEKLLLARIEKEPLFVKEAVEAEPLTLVEQYAAFLNNIKGTQGSDTWDAYWRSYEHFKSHMTEAGQLNLSPAKFTEERYNKFVVYLREHFSKGMTAKVQKHFKRAMKKIVSREIKLGLDPRDVIKYKEEAGLKIVLDDVMLKKIYDLKLDSPSLKHLSIIRWTFLLHCYTGPRVSDFFRVMGEHLRNKDVIKYTNQKTGSMVELPITPIVREILEKLNYTLPEITDNYYNRALKEVYEAADPKGKCEVRNKSGKVVTEFIHKKIRSHDAVRTFITRCINQGISIPAIALMSGKTIAVILKHYYVPSQKAAAKELLDKF